MHLLSFIFILTPSITNAQIDTMHINRETGKYELSETVSVDSMSGDALYSNAKIFMTHAFKNSKEVTQLNDDISKTVIGKGSDKVFMKVGFGPDAATFARFTITIQAKDKKFKYTITDFEIYTKFDNVTTTALEDSSYWFKNRLHKKGFTEFKTQIEADMYQLTSDLKKQIIASKDF